jgi:hypothetical protein
MCSSDWYQNEKVHKAHIKLNDNKKKNTKCYVRAMIRIEEDQIWYEIFHSIDSFVYNDYTELLTNHF